MGDPGQGIVHVIGPEQGRTLPGMTIVCGDSHTSTHGAFGALAFGIGTSEVEHVLATQTLPQQRAKTLAITVDGELPAGSTAKDIILAILGRIGTGGGIGHIAEYRGSAIRALSMEGRMTVCNMSIEAGAKAGLIAPDDTTFAYLQGREHAPSGDAWDAAVADWRSLATDDDATFDKEVVARRGGDPAARLVGHEPRTGRVDRRARAVARLVRRRRGRGRRPSGRSSTWASTPARRSVTSASTPCSSARARTAASRTCAPRPTSCAAVRSRRASARSSCPGRGRSRTRPRPRGSTSVFTAAGFDWREPGCSMCLAMNPDKLAPGERCASTSNRNFEGRQGRGGRTHLVSPAVAAATAIAGHFATPEDLR